MANKNPQSDNQQTRGGDNQKGNENKVERGTGEGNRTPNRESDRNRQA